MIAEKELNADCQKELNNFLQLKLSTKFNEQELNEACIKFVKNKSYKYPKIAVLYGCCLVEQLFIWGLYPTSLISYLSSFKAKTKFEEVDSREVTERLSEILIVLISDNLQEKLNSVYFKLLGLQHFQNLKSKKLLDRLIQVSLASIGQYVATDKLVYIILIKLSLKISDDIKEFKVVIAEKVLSVIFMMFSKFNDPHFLSHQEIMKNYLYYLKLLVTFGKEITDIASCGEVEYDEKYRLIKEEKHDHFTCLTKVLVFNMFLNGNKLNQFEFPCRDHREYRNLIASDTFKIRIRGQFNSKHSDYLNTNQMMFDERDLECDQYAKNYDSEQEIIEKIKSNSTKILTIFVRNIPELFTGANLDYFIPKTINKLDIESFTKSKDFIPHGIYTKNIIRYLNKRKKDNMLMSINLHLVEAGFEHDYLNSSKQLTYSKLSKIKNQVLEILMPDKHAGINIVIAMIQETKYETKAAIIELLCIFQEVLYRRSQVSKGLDQSSSETNSGLHKLQQQDGVERASQSLFFLFTLELYQSKYASMKLVLEGMSFCSLEPILTSAPPFLCKNIIDFFILPILSTCIELNHDILKEFEKFLLAIFDAGFSEYFLSKIEYIKEILIRNLRIISQEKTPSETFLPKVRLYLALIDRIVSKPFDNMLDMLPFLSDMYINDILKVETYAEIHYFVPLLFQRILVAQKRIGTRMRLTKGIRSFSTDQTPINVDQFDELKKPIKADEDLDYLPVSDERKYLFMDHQIKFMYTEMFIFSANHSFTDSYEIHFINAFTSISSRLIYYINLELQQEKHLSIQECLMVIMNKMRTKKNKLQLVDYILSNQHMTMFDVRRKMWLNLFDMFKDKVLSVEIVFTNYNIIYGLRDFQQIINERWIVEIFYQTVSSMKSKNRKLINNCLKIFAYILGYYSFSILTWILEMDVPNVFYDEMEGECRKKSVVPSLDFLGAAFRKFILHKYSKFNLITMDSLWIILNKHEMRNCEISHKLVEFVDSIAPTVFMKLNSTESYKMKNIAMKFLLRRNSLKKLSLPDLKGILDFCFQHLFGDHKHLFKEFDQTEKQQLKILYQNTLSSIQQIESHVLQERTVEEQGKVISEIIQILLRYLKEICRLSHEIKTAGFGSIDKLHEDAPKFGPEHHAYLVGLCERLNGFCEQNFTSEEREIAVVRLREIKEKILQT